MQAVADHPRKLLHLAVGFRRQHNFSHGFHYINNVNSVKSICVVKRTPFPRFNGPNSL
jgi:hypothetical protein